MYALRTSHENLYILSLTICSVFCDKMSFRNLSINERIKYYNEAMNLRKKYGWGFIRIARNLSLPNDLVRHWLYHGRNPINSGNPNFFIPKPSSELAYVIGVRFGDADLQLKRKHSERGGRTIRLRARDKDFVSKFALFTAKLLKKDIPYKISLEDGQYKACSYSCQLYDFLNKQLKDLENFIEVFPSEFLKGLFDSEGSPKVSVVKWKKWKWLSLNVSASNTNLELLIYVQKLLENYKIKANIKASHKAGTSFLKDGKKNIRTKDAYELIIYKIEDIKLFSSKIGFIIDRKQTKLMDAIKIFENYKTGSERVDAWLRVYRKQNYIWEKIRN